MNTVTQRNDRIWVGRETCRSFHLSVCCFFSQNFENFAGARSKSSSACGYAQGSLWACTPRYSCALKALTGALVQCFQATRTTGAFCIANLTCKLRSMFTPIRPTTLLLSTVDDLTLRDASGVPFIFRMTGNTAVRFFCWRHYHVALKSAR